MRPTPSARPSDVLPPYTSLTPPTGAAERLRPAQTSPQHRAPASSDAEAKHEGWWAIELCDLQPPAPLPASCMTTALPPHRATGQNEASPAAAAFAQAVPPRSWQRLACGMVLGTACLTGLGVGLSVVQDRRSPAPPPDAFGFNGTYHVVGARQGDGCRRNGVQVCSPVIGASWRVLTSHASAAGLSLLDEASRQTVPLLVDTLGTYHLTLPPIALGNDSGCAVEQRFTATLRLLADQPLTANATTQLRQVDPTCTPTHASLLLEDIDCGCNYTLSSQRADSHQTSS